MISDVYRFRRKTTRDATESQVYTVEIDQEKELLLEKVKKKKNFHRWFNDMFEKSEWHQRTMERGHGDWLRSDADIDDRKTTMGDMAQAFERKKGEVRAVVVRKDVEDAGTSGGYFLDDGEVERYGDTDVFAKMRYDDVRDAHTNTVVPVTHQDFVERKKYGSVGQLQTARSEQDTAPLSESHALRFLADKERLQTGMSTRRAYNLLREEERGERTTMQWWSSLKQIGDV